VSLFSRFTAANNRFVAAKSAFIFIVAPSQHAIMSVVLQAGGPVNIELLIVLGITVVLFLVNIGVAVWISRDAKRRSQPHAFAWGAGSFLGVFFGGMGGFVVWVLYFVVRDETGTGAPSVREDS
jgi:hypothetical protein